MNSLPITELKSVKERSYAMKLKTLLIIKAAVCLCLGIPILLVPDFIYSIFGATLAAGGVFAAREYGASLIGNLLLTWFARNSQHSDARWAIILALCVYDALGVVVTLIAILSGVLNPLAWLVVALYLFLALGFGYFLLPKK
jgi:hypothetical protein